tara:strand:+ start:141 stop:635 length:495 start_codon:yes stop_codon:yes gene_type:complete
MSKINQGLPTILGVNVEDISPKVKQKVKPIVTPSVSPIETLPDLTRYMKPLNLPKEVKDEYGYTPAQNKVIQDYYTRDDRGSSKGAFKKFVKDYGEPTKLVNSEILKNNINDRPKRDILDYIDQQRHIYEGTPLSEKNKKINKNLERNQKEIKPKINNQQKDIK